MTQEEKRLLIKDLCARLPYWPDIKTTDGDKGYIVGIDDTEEGIFHVHILEDGDSYTCDMSIEKFKAYLRPMSSMTDDEEEEYNSLNGYEKGVFPHTEEAFDWLNEHHFDYRGLIEKSLALEAPEGMYKSE